MNVTPRKAAQTEYAIYTYDHFDEKSFGVNKWQKYKTLANLKRAMNEARVLYRSNQYQKVEVKEKYIDSRLERPVSKTLRVFDMKSKKQKTALFYGAAAMSSALLLAALTVLQ